METCNVLCPPYVTWVSNMPVVSINRGMPPVAPTEMASLFHLKRTDTSCRVCFHFEVWFASVVCLLALGH